MSIYLVKMEDGESHYVKANNQLHLLQTWEMGYCGFREIEQVIEISFDEAKNIMIPNPDYEENPEFEDKENSLYDLSLMNEDFSILASTEYL